jgi:L-amino acid N-acyltransferase YncA
MQTPCFLITNHDVQIPIAEFFKSQNALYYAGHHTDTDADNIKISFTKFIKDENALRKYKQNMASLIDGKGLARIANAITSPPITLISATANHCQRVYDWRNHPTTRHYSGNNQEINIQDHNKWFERKLNDPDTYIFIASKHNEEIGVLRFDPAENGFVVSLYLAPDHHGYGYGASILLKAVKTLKEKGLTPLTLLAKISPDNKASQNAFKKAGFVQTASDDWKKSLS